MIGRSAIGIVLLAMLAACQVGAGSPAALESSRDTCASCRMAVSEARLASQIVVPHEEPRFFDDLGCLGRYLSAHPTLPSAARVYVADHRTKDWVPADQALYSQVPSITAPMGSHVVAHASAASRDEDRSVTGGVAVTIHDVFGDHLPRGGQR